MCLNIYFVAGARLSPFVSGDAGARSASGARYSRLFGGLPRDQAEFEITG